MESGPKSREELDRLGVVRCDIDLLSVRAKKLIAVSRMRLIGLNDVVIHLTKIAEIENRFRQQLIFDEEVPTRDELDEFSKQIRDHYDRFYESLHEAFIAIYD